jgi:hypothetical protein
LRPATCHRIRRYKLFINKVQLVKNKNQQKDGEGWNRKSEISFKEAFLNQYKIGPCKVVETLDVTA